MSHFFSCDWGTSSFRLRLIKADTLDVLAEENTGSGIAEVYRLWKHQEGSTSARLDFYAARIREQLMNIGRKMGIRTDNVPVILSGMASSSIGMMDLPYKELPFRIDGSDLNIEFFSSDFLSNPFIIVSGARSDSDVMRGEETKIVGCAHFFDNSQQNQLLVLPGTHPKHIAVKARKVTGFKTYMTGEFFDLLSKQSILSTSVGTGIDFNKAENRESFINGIDAGLQSNLLHAAFMVRTNQLLKQISSQENLHYLSGLLIGTELSSLDSEIPIYLISGATHSVLYKLACQHLRLNVVESIDADHALIKGHQVLFLKYFQDK